MQEKVPTSTYVHSVGIESTKLIFVGTRITYQATGDAGVPLFDHFPLSFFLRGLRWHLSGLSELPLEQCLFLLLAGESFPFSIRFSKSHFFPTLCFCGPFFCTMYGHVVEHLLLVYCSTASTAQHSTAQSARTKPQSKCVLIGVRQRKQADRKDILYCSTESTAHSTSQSARTKSQSRYVLIRVRQRQQAKSIYSVALQHCKRSTAQSARTKPQSKHVLIRVRQRRQVDRVGESQHMLSSIYTAC